MRGQQEQQGFWGPSPISKPEQQGATREVPAHSVSLGNGEGCGDKPPTWRLPAPGVSPASPELPAPGANYANETNPVCKAQHGPGLARPHLWGTSVPANPEQQERPISPQGAPGRTAREGETFPFAMGCDGGSS